MMIEGAERTEVRMMDIVKLCCIYIWHSTTLSAIWGRCVPAERTVEEQESENAFKEILKVTTCAWARKMQEEEEILQQRKMAKAVNLSSSC